jgi:hypothetical protein
MTTLPTEIPIEDATTEEAQIEPSPAELATFPDNSFNERVASAAVGAVVGAVVNALSPSSGQGANVPQGQAPSNAPQPGTQGGGASPNSNSATSAASLALTPAGLVPVAIFPPWTSPRTFSAVAVIFSEASGNSQSISTVLAHRIHSESRLGVRRFARRFFNTKLTSGLKIWKKIIKDRIKSFIQKSKCVTAR